MQVSPWRLVHLWLAIISAAFLLIASTTGAILAFEPVYARSHGYDPDAEALTVAQLIENTSRIYVEISSIKKDHNSFYQISTLTDAGEDTFYINPITGERLGEIIKTPALFDFARTLHRSLFFKEIGRFLVGITALVLVLIAIAGFILVVKKQGGLKRYFTNVIKESFNQDYHTRLGKTFSWPILFVGLTGTILFLVRFNVISAQVASHSYDFEQITSVLDDSGFTIFNETPLSEFKELIFPFSDFDDDYFELKLSDRELLIHQKTGTVLSRINYSKGKLLADFSFRWHTGEGQPWWAVLLGITSMSLLFFLYSGFAIYLKRKPSTSKWHNPFPQTRCEVFIAVGSELGVTAEKAGTFQQALIEAGTKSFISTMNAFEYAPNMKYLILMTSTYGKGDAPNNANRFIQKFNQTKTLHRSFHYAVAGFGSTAYPDFCQYAIDIDQLLEQHPSAAPLLPLLKIDDKDSEDFDRWVHELGKTLAVDMSIKLKPTKEETLPLQVKKKTFSPNSMDHTFLLELSCEKKKLRELESGDLLTITPENSAPRYYSMSVSKDKKTILLSVKRHVQGTVSKELARLETNELIYASFKKNPHFHFPKNATHVLLIANGTGIAPFLGMLESNRRNIPTSLFWGGQNEASLSLYESKLNALKERGKLRRLGVAYSRTEHHARYVQEVLKENEAFVVDILKNQGVIMICGSLAMLKGVEEVLDRFSKSYFGQSIEHFKAQNIIRSDCY